MADMVIPNLSNELVLKDVDVGTFLYIVAVLVVGYILAALLSYLVKRLSERAGVYRELVALFIPFLKIFVYVVAFYLVVTALIEPSFTQMVALSGILGVAIGFGLKDLLADLVGGIVITFEKPFQIGDKVNIGNYYGEVQEIGIRSTRIQTPDDELVTVPNYTFIRQPVSCGNAGQHTMAIFIDLFIHPSSDAQAAAKIVHDALVTSQYVIISKDCPFTVLVGNTPEATRIRARGYVVDHRFEFEFGSDVTQRSLAAFMQAGINPAGREYSACSRA